MKPADARLIQTKICHFPAFPDQEWKICQRDLQVSGKCCQLPAFYFQRPGCQKDRLELLFLFFPLFCSRPAGNSPRIRLLFPKIYLPWFCLFPVLPLWTTLLLPPGIRLSFPSSGLHPRQQKHFHCQKDHLCSPQDPFILKQAMDSKKSSCSRRKNCHKYSDGYGHCL